MPKYPTTQTKQLIKAFANLKDEKEVQKFLRDLMTAAEITEFSNRFEIARLLWTTELSYAKIAAKVKTSTTTVTRVAHWLNKENLKGYKTVLDRMFPKS
jgi:TrpR-related protein YerC/YecD